MFTLTFSCLLVLLPVLVQNEPVSEDANQQRPTIVVAFMVRNKAHTLPYFLHYFEQLDYPKHRMALWIRADHNIDSSVEILESWLKRNQDSYHWVDYWKEDNGYGYSDEAGPCDWSRSRFSHIIKVKQEALNTAKQVWADFILYTDVDNFLKNDQLLNDLISQRKTIVAPMLNVTASEHYSNFWGAMDEKGYYKRSDDYKSIQLGHNLGCFPVALVHSTFLINLRREESQSLAFQPSPPGYQGPFDDLIIFAHSAMFYGVQMHVLNTDFYGYLLLPLESENTLENERQLFSHLKIENIIYHTPLEKLSYVSEVPRPKDKLGLDQVYMINLERRPDRREKMFRSLDVLGIDFQLINAVDGKQLNDSYLEKLGVKMLSKFADPYKGRAMTMGEIGCFLSHYTIWNDIIENNYEKILIFEDDIRFEPYFRESFAVVLSDLKNLNITWDLIYLGRKRLHYDREVWLEGSDILMWPHYSYWTLSYMLSRQGADKLLAQEPLTHMVPVDEYLPIMFDRHPESIWKENFSPRDLVALSAQPLLVHPSHYTGEPGYITDTEDSEVISDKLKGHGPANDAAGELDIKMKGDLGEMGMKSLNDEL